jgi:putative ABC transport system permease protein
LTESQEWNAKQSYSVGLRLDDMERIMARTPHAESIAPVVNVRAALQKAPKGFNPEIIATTQAYREILGLHLAEGRFLAADDVKRKNLSCCIGWDVFESLGPGGRVGQSLRIEDMSFQIVGILQERGWNGKAKQPISVRNIDRTIMIPIGTENSIQDSPSAESRLSEILIKLAEESDISLISSFVFDTVREAHGGIEDFTAIVPEELLNEAKRTHAVYNAVLGCIAAISLLVGGIGIMNIMLATISERTREIGIRRAVGANRRHIFLQFLIEAVILAIIGGVLGIAGGALVSAQIAKFIGWKTVITGWAVALSFITSVLIGVCSGTYPAIRAARMDPIEALRFE